MREKEKGAISAATILVVEDETLILMMIADHLRDAGLTVIEAKHAGEALAILSKSAAIDLVITDVRMPVVWMGWHSQSASNNKKRQSR